MVEILKEGLTFNDVLLIPEHSDIKSRDEIDITTDFLGLRLNPIIAAPMDYVINVPVMKILIDNGYYGILHRFGEYEGDKYREAQELMWSNRLNYGVAIGAKSNLNNLDLPIWAHSVCIDVAHGDHSLVVDKIKKIKELYPGMRIIAGNVATASGFQRLALAGADAIRVGIGPGSACTTRIRTGVGYPQLSAIMECAVEKKYHNASLIADGGIESSGDIVKALAAGADMVMIGKLLAGHNESPGEHITIDGKHYKPYRGQSMFNSNGRRNAPEGVSGYIPMRGALTDTLKQLESWIKSGLSYVGARDLTELRESARFIKVSPATQLESSTRLLEI
jgi:IMP dehydrogenase